MDKSGVYALTKAEKNQEKIAMLAANLAEKCKLENIHTIGLTTSTKYMDYKKKAGKLLAEEMRKAGCPARFITDFEGVSSKGNEILLVNLAPVHLYAKAVQQARQLDAVVSVERYAHTKYTDFENLLKTLEDKQIKFLGVIAHR